MATIGTMALTLIIAAGAVRASGAAGVNNELTALEKAQGFTSLFDGKNIDQWVNYKKDADDNTDISPYWKIIPEDSAFGKSGSTGAPNIRSAKKYSDFEFRAEYRLSSGANSGIIYRATTRGSEAYHTGPEYALDDARASTRTTAGSVFDVFPAIRNASYSAATRKWNLVGIIAVGDSIEHWLNGEKVVSYRIGSPAWKAGVCPSKWCNSNLYCLMPDGSYIKEGYLMLQGNHDGDLSMRNLRIAPLPLKGSTGLGNGGSDPRVMPMAIIGSASGGYRIRLPDPGRFRLEIRTPKGNLVDVLSGRNSAEYVLSRDRFAPGIYIATYAAFKGTGVQSMSRMLVLP